MLLAVAASYVAPGESSIGVGKTSLSDAPRYLRLFLSHSMCWILDF